MDRHRTRFLANLSARLDQARAMRESQVETPPIWRRHPEGSDPAGEPVPAEIPEATRPFGNIQEPDERTTPAQVIATPRYPERRGPTIEALRRREPDQTSVTAVPWSETGMSQALRDAIASVRRVSRHEMDELPPPRSDQAQYEAPFEDDPADEQASFDRAETEDRASFDEYALREEVPFDHATAAERFDDQPLYEEPPLADNVADARASLDEYALREEPPFDDGADAPLPFGGRARRAASSFDLPAAAAPLRFADDMADEQPLFDDGAYEHAAQGLREEPSERPPLWRGVTQRRSLHFAAFAVATMFVLLAGFGLGILSGAQELGRLVASFGWTPLADATVGATQTDSAPSSANRTPSSGSGIARPAERDASPQLSELETVRVAPLPATPTIEQSPEPATTNDMPLPPPPKPAFRSSLSGEARPASDRIAGAVDDAVEDAAVALLEADGAGGPFEPILVKTSVAGPRVFVHYTDSAPGSPATALHLVRHLKAAGFTVEGRAVEFPIPKHSIRYFFDSDRDDAEAVGAQLQGQVPGDADVPILDFTSYEPKPREGHLEVWLGR